MKAQDFEQAPNVSFLSSRFDGYEILNFDPKNLEIDDLISAEIGVKSTLGETALACLVSRRMQLVGGAAIGLGTVLIFSGEAAADHCPEGWISVPDDDDPTGHRCTIPDDPPPSTTEKPTTTQRPTTTKQTTTTQRPTTTKQTTTTKKPTTTSGTTPPTNTTTPATTQPQSPPTGTIPATTIEVIIPPTSDPDPSIGKPITSEQTTIILQTTSTEGETSLASSTTASSVVSIEQPADSVDVVDSLVAVPPKQSNDDGSSGNAVGAPEIGIALFLTGGAALASRFIFGAHRRHKEDKERRGGHAPVLNTRTSGHKIGRKPISPTPTHRSQTKLN